MAKAKFIFLLVSFVLGFMAGTILGVLGGITLIINEVGQALSYMDADITINLNETKLVEEINRTIKFPTILNTTIPERTAYYYNIDNQSEIYSRIEGSGEMPKIVK